MKSSARPCVEEGCWIIHWFKKKDAFGCSRVRKFIQRGLRQLSLIYYLNWISPPKIDLGVISLHSPSKSQCASWEIASLQHPLLSSPLFFLSAFHREKDRICLVLLSINHGVNKQAGRPLYAQCVSLCVYWCEAFAVRSLDHIFRFIAYICIFFSPPSEMFFCNCWVVCESFFFFGCWLDTEQLWLHLSFVAGERKGLLS